MVHKQLKLLRGLKKGNNRIYKSIFDQYYEKLFYYALKFVSSKEIAEEVVQEVFITIWEKRKELKVNSSLQSYLYTAVKNRAISYLRTNYFNHEFSSEIRADKITTSALTNRHTEEYLEHKELELIVKNEIEALPDRCRIIFKLSRNSGLSYKEIAKELNISAESVKTQISIALKRIKLQLENYGL